MILVDTSIWVDHLRSGVPQLTTALQESAASALWMPSCSLQQNSPTAPSGRRSVALRTWHRPWQSAQPDGRPQEPDALTVSDCIRGLKTDHWFYRLFQSAPDLIGLRDVRCRSALRAAGIAGPGSLARLDRLEAAPAFAD